MRANATDNGRATRAGADTAARIQRGATHEALSSDPQVREQQFAAARRERLQLEARARAVPAEAWADYVYAQFLAGLDRAAGG